MSKKVISKEQLEFYGKFVGEPWAKQLREYFLLDDYDLRFVNSLRTESNKLGFAVQLGTVRFIGVLPRESSDIPDLVID